MSKSIKLENVKEGMVLSTAQVNKYGQVLLGTGTKLENHHIRILKTWGIDSIQIIDDEDENNLKAYKKQKADAEAQLQSRMLFEPSNIYEVDMFRAAVQHKLKSI